MRNTGSPKSRVSDKALLPACCVTVSHLLLLSGLQFSCRIRVLWFFLKSPGKVQTPPVPHPRTAGSESLGVSPLALVFLKRLPGDSTATIEKPLI